MNHSQPLMDRLVAMHRAARDCGLLRRLAGSWLFAMAVLSALACGERRSMEVTVTAFNSVPSQTDSRPTEAAWGDLLEPGVKAVAVSPDLLEAGLERGARVKIEGLPGRYVVLDRTASRLRRRVDVYMGTDVEAAMEFGIREARITWRE